MSHASAACRLDELGGHLPATMVVEVIGDPTTAISGITHDSRRVVPGDLFVCVPGAEVDGHEFAPDAVAAGAGALIVGRRLDLPVPQIVVTDPRRAMGPAASVIHGDPSTTLTVVGITGTNGKTTTAHLLGAILHATGRSVRVFGTLTGARTTPEATELQKSLADCRDEGVEFVVMEVSSHALELGRVDGTRFAVSIFTNLGRDHLDLHGTSEAYFRAKARLFTPALSDRAVVNADDPHGQLLADTATVPTVTFSRSEASEIEISMDRHRFTWRGHRVEVPLGGSTNLANSLAALTAAEVLGVDAKQAAVAAASLSAVPGRFEIVAATPSCAFTVMVDYAHTPEALTTLLEAVRSTGSGRILVVFGCGGDRDRDKRPLMGRAAAAGADVVLVTSDNPRGEEPSAIAADIVSGMSSADQQRTTVLLDRQEAIEAAVASAGAGDVVVIAGKGHETTQVIDGEDLEFDDRAVARTAVERSVNP